MRIIFREVAQSLRRNASMVVSVVLVTFISLTFVGAAALLQMQIGQMKTYWYAVSYTHLTLPTTSRV